MLEDQTLSAPASHNSTKRTCKVPRQREIPSYARRNAVNANPDDATLLLDLGKTFANAGQLDSAIVVLGQAASANPRDARPQFYLGVVAEKLGQSDKARTAFTQFTALAPSRYERQVGIAKQHLASLH